MLHAQFQDHRSSGSGEEDFKGFNHIWTWLPSWLCDLDHSYELSSGSFCQIYRVTDEALIAETMLCPNFFLMNVFFAFKGSKHFTIISYHCSWMLCRVAVVKSLPALIYSADYILLLVL